MKLDDLHARWMRDDPEYRAAYGASEEEFTLAAALIGARAAAGLTQEELARRMGTSQAQIARMESGRYLPSSRTLQRLAEATGTRLRVVFVRSDQLPSLSDATLRAVRAHGGGATAREVLDYLSREFGMTVQPNSLGIELRRHRSAGKLEEHRDHRWFTVAADPSPERS